MLTARIAALPVDLRVDALTQWDRNGVTLMRNAIKNGNPTLVQAILKMVPEDQRVTLLSEEDNTEQEYTPIYEAIDNGDPAMVRTILKMVPKDQCVELFTKDDGVVDSPIMQAVYHDQPEMLEAMLEATPVNQHAALLNAYDFEGDTALAVIALSDNPAILHKALKRMSEEQRVACVNHMNGQGKTPLQVVEERTVENNRSRHLTAAGVLMAYGAIVPPQASPQLLAFLNEAKAHVARRCDEYSKVLTDSIPTPGGGVRPATPEEVRKALQWFQRFPRGTGIINWDLASQRCNAFLTQKQTELFNLPNKSDAKIEMLKRIQPILRSGIPCNAESLDAIGVQGQQVTGKPWNAFTQETVNAGADAKGIVVNLANFFLKQVAAKKANAAV